MCRQSGTEGLRPRCQEPRPSTHGCHEVVTISAVVLLAVGVGGTLSMQLDGVTRDTI